MRILSFIVSLFLVFGMVVMPGTSSHAGIFISVNISPPALPVYVQPEPPADGYIWVPGYWAYDSFFEDYYWVPGTWGMAPTPGYLWTPGYWGWRNGAYVFNDGYWGPHIGFYGGINYGWGYGGHGYSGGAWNNGVFVRNTNVSNATNVTNITNNTTINNTSFSGGPGGVQAQPTPEEKVAMQEKHIPATAEQTKNVQAARKNPAFRASVNHGKPAVAATSRPGVFKGKGVVAARKAGAFYNKTKPAKSRTSGHKAAAGAKHKGTAQYRGNAQHKALSHAKPKPGPKKHVVKKPVHKTPPPKKVEPNPNGGSSSGY